MTSLDGRIRAFCKEQQEWLEQELQSEQQQQEVESNSHGRQTKNNDDESGRSTVLHCLQVANVGIGLYGRTVVQLESSSNNNTRLLPAHRFTTGDEVEIRSKSGASTSSHHPAGVICQVTEDSISIALFDTKKAQAAKKSKASKKAPTGETNVDDDDDESDVVGPPPLSLIPKSSIEVHKKLVAALQELEREGTGHVIAGKVVQALFEAPKDDPLLTSSPPQPPLDAINTSLDDSQLQAIQFCLDQKRPLSLIHGPPGTGKTTTVVELIRQAVIHLNYKVLVCAPSNVAVDNVLSRLVMDAHPRPPSKIKSRGSRQNHNVSTVKVVRLGHPARLQTNILPYSLEALVQSAEGTEIVTDVRRELESFVKIASSSKSSYADKRLAYREIKALRKEVRMREEKVVSDLIDQAQVVLCTCVGAANNRILNRVGKDGSSAGFDLVVIDEAAQSLEAACWIPTLRGRKLVLAGDHCQLPPTIKSNNSRVQKALSQTMFERVMELYGDSLTASSNATADEREKISAGRISRMLQVQYRMNEKIADWASRALYGGQLQSHESVRQRTIGQLEGLQKTDDEDNTDITETALLLIDTASCGLHESTNAAGSRYNVGEAEIVSKHVKRLLRMGVKQPQIAIITPYNGQVEILRTSLLSEYPKLEIRSVDGFQGGEREAVVLSLVRSSDRGGKDGIGFLKDDRRLNVAVTRSKRHCCVVCDTETVSQSKFVKDLIDWIGEHGEHRSALEFIEGMTYEHDSQMAQDFLLAEQELSKLMVEDPVHQAKNKFGSKGSTQSTRNADDEEKVAELMEAIRKFVSGAKPGDAMRLSSTLTKAHRKLVHEEAEKLGIHHRSEGTEGVDRRLILTIDPVAPSSNEVQAEEPTVESTVDETREVTLTETLPEPGMEPRQSFALLGSNEESEDDKSDRGDRGDVEIAEGNTQGTSSKDAGLNSVLGQLAKERVEREKTRASRPKEANTGLETTKNKKKKKKGQKLGGQKKEPKEEPDDTNLDDMAFLDAQIEKVQTSHGRKVEGKGNYRTVVNGILLSKPAPQEKKKNPRASSALQAKLKEAQNGRKAKTKKKN